MTPALRLPRIPLPIPNPNPNGRKHINPPFLSTPLLSRPSTPTISPIPTPSLISSPSAKRRISCSQKRTAPARYAVLGAGFAGLSVAWHLFKHSPKESRVCVDIYDEVGVGGGASGASGGLLHPYSPKAKVLWRGGECWKECLKLLTVAEGAVQAKGLNLDASSFNFDEPIVLRRGILRPATTGKNAEILKENSQNCLQSCTLEVLDGEAAHCLVPNLHLPFNSAIYMPEAMNIHPKKYLQALFLACLNLTEGTIASDCEEREMKLYRLSVSSLHELAGKYDAVIVCLGAKSSMLLELKGKLPLRTCRGVIAQLQLPKLDISGEYPIDSPSILSDAWLAFQGPQSVLMGSTWDWKSRNYSSEVTSEELSKAFEELLPKASTVYPAIKRWELAGARAGLRAMPPLTPLGSLPLLGCVNDLVEGGFGCNYWLVAGLGARGLLYHGLLGKLMAHAVISDDETVLPSELTSWKQTKLIRHSRQQTLASTISFCSTRTYCTPHVHEARSSTEHIVC